MDDVNENEAAARLLSRLGDFSAGLEDDERELFAVLIGPGIAALNEPAEDEVVGFGVDQGQQWQPTSLQSKLAVAAANSNWNVTRG